MLSGVELIAVERQRQLEVKGWTSEHDDAHSGYDLSRAAECYIEAAKYPSLNPAGDPAIKWPWDTSWWRPSDPVRNLIKAGALIAAEIDRLQRVA